MRLTPQPTAIDERGEVSAPMTALTQMRNRGGIHVSVYGDIAALPADVETFLSGYAGDELCLRKSWFELQLRYSPAANRKPRIYVVRGSGGETIDCVLFALCAADARRPRRLESLTNFYSMTYAPLFRPGLEKTGPVLDALADHIARERPAWDMIELHRLVQESPTTGELVSAFRRAGMFVDTFSQFENWFYPSAGVSAEAYFKSRPPPVRAVTRKTKQAQKKHEMSFHLCMSVDALTAGLDDYQRVYAGSWKDPEAFPEFIPQLLRHSAASGSLRLGVLRLDGEPAAAQIWIITGRRATIYKVAYHEKFAPLSAGSILSKMIFDYVLDHDNVTEIDYGVGSERYKLDWMSDCRHIVGLICFNPYSVTGLLAATRHFGGNLKRRLTQTRGKQSA